jgi:hypothetical protein
METPHDPNHPGSNATPLTKAEHDLLMAELGPIIRGLGYFRPKSEHEHRLDLEREMRPKR